MTVKELIDQLKQYPEDVDVEFSDDEGESPIADVEEENGCVYLVGAEEE